MAAVDVNEGVVVSLRGAAQGEGGFQLPRGERHESPNSEIAVLVLLPGSGSVGARDDSGIGSGGSGVASRSVGKEGPSARGEGEFGVETGDVLLGVAVPAGSRFAIPRIGVVVHDERSPQRGADTPHPRSDVESPETKRARRDAKRRARRRGDGSALQIDDATHGVRAVEGRIATAGDFDAAEFLRVVEAQIGQSVLGGVEANPVAHNDDLFARRAVEGERLEGTEPAVSLDAHSRQSVEELRERLGVSRYHIGCVERLDRRGRQGTRHLDAQRLDNRRGKGHRGVVSERHAPQQESENRRYSQPATNRPSTSCPRTPQRHKNPRRLRRGNGNSSTSRTPRMLRRRFVLFPASIPRRRRNRLGQVSGLVGAPFGALAPPSAAPTWLVARIPLRIPTHRCGAVTDSHRVPYSPANAGTPGDERVLSATTESGRTSLP